MGDSNIFQLAKQCIDLLRSKSIKVALAESCTGGLLSGYLTSVPGASEVIDRGFVTYSNQSKIDLLNVSDDDINEFGSVSEEVASAMSRGALNNSVAALTVGITGIAGPVSEGKKPIGLVYISVSYHDGTVVREYNFNGRRDEIRLSTITEALNLMIDVANQ